MHDVFSGFVWGALQVSAFALIVAMLLVLTRRYLRGLASDMLTIGMTLILVVSIAALVPVPTGWSVWSLVQSPLAENCSISDPPNVVVDENVSEPISNFALNDPIDPIASKVDSATGVVQGQPSQPRVESLPGNQVAVTAGSLAEQLTSFWGRFEQSKIDLSPIAESPAIVPAAAQNLDGMPWIQLIAWLMLCFVVFGVARLVMGLFAIRRLVKSCVAIDDPDVATKLDELKLACQVNREVRLLMTAELTTPATVGWWRAAILLPNDWSERTERELLTLLSHELVHIRNHDFARNLISQSAIAINFFNPLVHWLGRELRVSQELVADHFAARLSGGPENYLTAMAEMAISHDSRTMGWLAQPFLPTRKTFMRRIEMLRTKRKLLGVSNRLLKLVTGLALVSLAIVCIGLQLPVSNQAVAQTLQTPQVLDGPPLNQINQAAKSTLFPSQQKADGFEKAKKLDEVLLQKSVQNALQSDPHNGPHVRRTPNELARKRQAYVSDRTKFFLAVDFSKLGKVDHFTELINSLATESGSTMAPVLNHAQAATLQVHDLESATNSGGLVLHYHESLDPSKVFAEAKDAFRYRGVECRQSGNLMVAVLNENRTVLLGLNKASLESMLDAGVEGPVRSEWPELFDAGWRIARQAKGVRQSSFRSPGPPSLNKNRPVVTMPKPAFQPQGDSTMGQSFNAAAVVFVASRTGMEYVSQGLSAPRFAEMTFGPLGSMFSPLYEKTDMLAAAIDVAEDDLKLDLLLRASNKNVKVQVKETAIALKVMMNNSLRNHGHMLVKNLANDRMGLTDDRVAKLVQTIHQSVADVSFVDGKDDFLLAKSQLKLPRKELAEILGGAMKYRNMYSQMHVNKNHLRQLQLGMLNYESVHQKWPGAVMEKHDHPYSWRVAILPYLGHNELYEQYRFSEPWDSEHNRAVTAKMPSVFRHPKDHEDSTNSGYFVVTGDKTPFPDKKQTGISDMLDGTSNTAMIFESKRKVHWAKPEDIVFRPGKMKAELGGFYKDLVNFVRGDGSVLSVKKQDIREEEIDFWIMPADGTPIQMFNQRPVKANYQNPTGFTDGPPNAGLNQIQNPGPIRDIRQIEGGK